MRFNQNCRARKWGVAVRSIVDRGSSVRSRMSSNKYRAVLRSLDDDDVVRGLGRRVKPKNKEKSCCAKCCSSPFTKWFCITLCLVVGLAMSVAIPLVIVLPVESQWHFHHWLDKWTLFTANSSFNQQDLRNSSSALPEEPRPEGVSGDSAGSSNNASRVATFIAETVHQWKLMTEWMKQRYAETPKVPLFIGLAIPLVGCLIIMCVVIRRKIKRRQRRRAFGKLVNDLQSGKTLLADTDDSDEDCLYDAYSKNI